MRFRRRSWLWLVWALLLAGVAGLSGALSRGVRLERRRRVRPRARSGHRSCRRRHARSCAVARPVRDTERARAEGTRRGRDESRRPAADGSARHCSVAHLVAGVAVPLGELPRARPTSRSSDKKTESPPDTSGAVGRDKLMSTLNSNYVIQRKSDGAGAQHGVHRRVLGAGRRARPVRPARALRPVQQPLARDAPPTIRCSATLGDLYGISDTADPQGSWHLYAIDADPTDATWADYPDLGFSRSSVAIGINMFATGDARRTCADG